MVTFTLPISYHPCKNEELLIGVTRIYCVSRNFGFPTRPKRWKEHYSLNWALRPERARGGNTELFVESY